jgi:uncharacterized protein YndB with AHSA1/START domain
VIADGLEIETPADEPVIRFRRFVNAPPALVFTAWTDPAALVHWWGPAQWTLIVCEVDLRVGGGYRFVHQTPEGHRHGSSGDYLEIDPGRRLVNTFVFDGTPDRKSVDSTDFLTAPGGTLVSGISRHESITARDDHVNGGMERGMRDTYQRLDEWIEALPDKEP